MLLTLVLWVPIAGRALVPLTIAVAASISLSRPQIGFVSLAFLAPLDAYVPGFRIYKDLLWSDLLLVVVLVSVVRYRRIGVKSIEHGIALLALVAIGLIQ